MPFSPIEILTEFCESSVFGTVHGLSPQDRTAMFWARFERDRIPLEQMACENCGLVILVELNGRSQGASNRRFCSETCALDNFKATRRAERAAKLDRKEANCETCKVAMTLDPMTQRKRFCSDRCRIRAKRGYVGRPFLDYTHTILRGGSLVMKRDGEVKVGRTVYPQWLIRCSCSTDFHRSSCAIRVAIQRETRPMCDACHAAMSSLSAIRRRAA